MIAKVSRSESTRLFLTSAVCFVGLSWVSGCDSASFVPPPPPEVSDSAEQVAHSLSPLPPSLRSTAKEESSFATSRESVDPRQGRSGSSVVKLVLSQPPDSDHLLLGQALRRELGKAKIPFRVVMPEPDEPSFSRRLTEAVRATVAGDGLIVDFNDDPALIELLYDASERGVSILTLDRPLTPRGKKSHAWITYEPFTGVGRQIVETLLEAARRLPSSPEDRIVVLENRTPHRYRAERLASLVDALKAASRSYETVSFERDSDAASKALEQALSTGPKVAIVLAEEDAGMFAAQRNLVDRLAKNRPTFVLGGYFAYDIRSAGNVSKISALGDPSVERFAVRAFQTLQRLMDGKAVPEKTEVPISVHGFSTNAIPTESQSAETSRSKK